MKKKAFFVSTNSSNYANKTALKRIAHSGANRNTLQCIIPTRILSFST